MDKVVELVSWGSGINGPTPSSFYSNTKCLMNSRPVVEGIMGKDKRRKGEMGDGI